MWSDIFNIFLYVAIPGIGVYYYMVVRDNIAKLILVASLLDVAITAMHLVFSAPDVDGIIFYMYYMAAFVKFPLFIIATGMLYKKFMSALHEQAISGDTSNL